MMISRGRSHLCSWCVVMVVVMYQLSTQLASAQDNPVRYVRADELRGKYQTFVNRYRYTR